MHKAEINDMNKLGINTQYISMRLLIILRQQGGSSARQVQDERGTSTSDIDEEGGYGRTDGGGVGRMTLQMPDRLRHPVRLSGEPLSILYANRS